MEAQMQQLEQRLSELEEKIGALQANAPQDQISMVVFSGDLDRMLAAFIIATGAAAMFERVVMFFTFWATPALKETSILNLNP